MQTDIWKLMKWGDLDLTDFNLLRHIRGEDRDSIVVWIFNIGVEKYWNNIDGLISDKQEDLIVNHVEEMNLLITRRQDYLILRRKPSREYLAVLEKSGFEIPHIICPDIEDENKNISEIVVEDKKILSLLQNLVETNENVYFVPYGVSFLEEQIADICQLRLIGGESEKCKQLNNKIFSKEIAQKLGFMCPEGTVCRSVEEVKSAYKKLNKTYAWVIVKMPCNSSGRGMWIIDNEKKFKTVCMIINRFTKNDEDMPWIVEGWVEKKKDLNIQIYVSESGDVDVFSIKEQILNGTVYTGSIVPAEISTEQREQCILNGKKIGNYLYKNGFSGIFGVDALITTRYDIVPIIEINGRFTLSTYVSFIKHINKGKTVYSFYKRKHCPYNFNYDVLANEIKKRGLWLNDEGGLFVYTAATADSHLSKEVCRLFCIAVGDSRADVQKLYDVFEEICKQFEV